MTNLMSLYKEIILEHYKNPKNFGKLSNFTHEAESNNPLCGDKISMQVNVVNDVVADIAFSGEGCAISLASASILTETLKGKTLSEAKGFQPKDLTNLLGIEVGPVRIKCALLPLEVFKRAFL